MFGGENDGKEEEREKFKDLELASETSLKFWNNDIDDKVWDSEELMMK